MSNSKFQVFKKSPVVRLVIVIAILLMLVVLASQFYLEGPTITQTSDYQALVTELVNAVQHKDWEKYRSLHPDSFSEHDPVFSEQGRYNISTLFSGVDHVVVDPVLPLLDLPFQRKTIKGRLVYVSGEDLYFQAILVRLRLGWKIVVVYFPKPS